MNLGRPMFLPLARALRSPARTHSTPERSLSAWPRHRGPNICEDARPLHATEVSFGCFSVGLGTYFSGVMPLNSNALCDVMLHFNGEAAHWPRNRFLWLAVSADVQQLQPSACKYVLKSTDTPLRCTYHVSTDSEIVTTGTIAEVRIQFHLSPFQQRSP